jgi:acetyl esterase/lipase
VRALPPPSWLPRGIGAWVLGSLAVAATAVAAVLVHCMVEPVRWDGLGMWAAGALHFPLHLLVPAAVSALLIIDARRCRARLAIWLFGLTALVVALAAIVPAVMVWRQAGTWDVPVTLGEYFKGAAHLNLGEPQHARSVVYGTIDDTRLQLDVWGTGLPKNGPRRPAVVIVHGGAWTHGNRSMLPDWNRWLNKLGYEVFDVEYRMPPPERWLDEVGDVKSALGWLTAHAEAHYVDPARIAIMGGSAGGNLAMLAAYSAGDARLPPSTEVPAFKVRCVVNLYGPVDLELVYRATNSPDYTRPALREYLGGPPDEVPDRYRLLSPLNHVGAGTPPTITLLGTSDRLVATEQAERLDQGLAGAGVPHETYLIPATDHGFDVNWGGFATQIARDKIGAFLEKYLEP